MQTNENIKDETQKLFPLFFIHSFSTIAAPLAPVIVPADCSAENNSVTVSWQAPNKSFVEGYVLELDAGDGGEFRVISFFFAFDQKF